MGGCGECSVDNGEKFERRDFLLGVSGDTAFLWKTMFFYWVCLLGCGLSIFSVLILKILVLNCGNFQQMVGNSFH